MERAVRLNSAGDQTQVQLPNQAPGQDETGTSGYSGTRITRSGRTSYAYDAQGRLIARTTTTLSGKILTWTFSWNAEDRLTQVITPEHAVWRYCYDALGRRITRERLGHDGLALFTFSSSVCRCVSAAVGQHLARGCSREVAAVPCR
ncbi:hypothetical protein ACWCYZ_39505 [Streptomyces virginiae]